jgi:hypothetical protein
VNDCYRNFVLAKVTKTVSAGMLLCHTGPLPHKPGKTLRSNLFTPLRSRKGRRFGKNLLCAASSAGPAGLSWFRPKLSC